MLREEWVGKKKGKKSGGYEAGKNIGERNRRRKNGREENKGKEPEPVFLNVYGAQESVPRNKFRQSI
jgi:hypothetical protein